jgi:chlorite dismutase
MENQEKPLLVSFIAGNQGAWRIESIDAVVGESLPSADRLEVIESPSVSSSVRPAWLLRGVTSNVRYTNRAEVGVLNEKQQGLHRPQATRAALIPIRKNAAWWKLAQDERRRILEEDSHHIAVGLEYLPAIARRLHHSRDLSEPFDFLTWFECAPEQSAAFEELVSRLSHTKE